MEAKANYQILTNRVIFFVNGTGKAASLKVITILAASIFMTIFSLFIIIAANANMVAFVSILIAELAFVLLFFIAYTQGKFAPYMAILNQKEFILKERKTNSVLFTLPMNPDLLYVCSIQIKVGYVYKKMSALVYGREIKTEIETENPSPMATILCIGNNGPINDLKCKVMETLGLENCNH